MPGTAVISSKVHLTWGRDGHRLESDYWGYRGSCDPAVEKPLWGVPGISHSRNIAIEEERVNKPSEAAVNFFKQ